MNESKHSSRQWNAQGKKSRRPLLKFNSHAVGMAVAQPLGFEIDFVRNSTSGSAA